jgi:voltage-gated potassium channel
MRAGALWSRLGFVGLGIVAIFTYGIVGYRLFGFSLVDAVYMTILALTTLGFIPDRSFQGGEKVFTATIAVLGVTAFLGLLAVLGSILAEAQFAIRSRRRRMERKIATLQDHFVICAYGRVGRTVAREFEAEGVPFVVIDIKEDLEEVMNREGVLYIIDDPTSEGVLRRAGIERARGLVSAVDSDAQNVYITLTARALNPNIFIVARAAEPGSQERLLRAGANRVISPYVTSGRHMALVAMRPRVVDSLEVAERGDHKVRIDELVIEPGSRLVGRSLVEMCGETHPILLRRADGHVLPNPALAERLREGDLVLLLGDSKTLRPVEEG